MMKKFLKNIILFLIMGFLIGEVVARIFYLNSEIPMRQIDPNGIQKYIPNQKGKWKGGDHTWQINEMGWPGKLPESYNNLITVIGDSYIENFMNPDSCHQATYLKQNLPQYNFLEAARSGVSLIEALEISKQLDSIQPLMHLIYVHDSDFQESLVQMGRKDNLTQLDLNTNHIVYGVLKAPKIKRVLYNIKFLYYLYNRFQPQNLIRFRKTPIAIENKETNTFLLYDSLVKFIKTKYDLEKRVFILRPDTHPKIIALLKKNEFSFLLLNDGSRNWSFKHDSHWTCFGHKEVSNQVTQKINSQFAH